MHNKCEAGGDLGIYLTLKRAQGDVRDSKEIEAEFDALPHYEVQQTNFDWTVYRFNTFEECVKKAREWCFETTIVKVEDGDRWVVASWSPLSGLRITQYN